MRIIILNNNCEIINRLLTENDLLEFYKIKGDLFGFQYAISIFEYFFELDINSYGLKDINITTKVSDNGTIEVNIILKINPKDLSNIREYRLKEILKFM
jgi:hypothetical protein